MKLNTIYNLLKNFDSKKLKQFILYNLPNESARQGTGTIDAVEYEGLVRLSRVVQERSPNSIIIEIGALFGLSTQAL